MFTGSVWSLEPTYLLYLRKKNCRSTVFQCLYGLSSSPHLEKSCTSSVLLCNDDDFLKSSLGQQLLKLQFYTMGDFEEYA